MRLWTLHPKYLDAKGLVALWREGLLAKAVLENATKGYKNHSHLIRFKEKNQPKEYICEYLHAVLEESKNRGYKFDASKLPKRISKITPITETKGQLLYEWQHLLNKLKTRDLERYNLYCGIKEPNLPKEHPLFTIIDGDIRDWEKIGNKL